MIIRKYNPNILNMDVKRVNDPRISQKEGNKCIATACEGQSRIGGVGVVTKNTL